MRLAADLHIHSCLSPCAQDDMTPNNIAAMASLKGLAAISVCDHNSAGNSQACEQACQRWGLIFVPGMEVTTQEEIHVLCYFEKLDDLLDFHGFIDRHRLKIPNKPQLFGRQILMNAQDEQTGEEKMLLYSAVMLPIEQIEREISKRGGVMVPSHVNRPSNSLLANLGFIPSALAARVLEVQGEYKLPEGYHAIRSSDAHDLGSILEREFFLDVSDHSAKAFLQELLTYSL